MLNSIKNIFIPEKIGDRYILPQRILGFDIGTTMLRATQLLLKGNERIVEKLLEQPISQEVDRPEAVATALLAIMAQADKPHHMVTALSSSVVVFKKLTVPFLEREKIQQVMGYEVASLLPFPLDQAVVDFIITEQDTENNRSTILIAAVQHQHIEHHLAPFKLAQLDPELVTVDFFALYNLYQQTSALTEIPDGVVIIDVGTHTTRMAYVYNGKLNAVRSLPNGNQSLMQFTLRSFVAQSEPLQQIKKIFLVGDGITVAAFNEQMSSALGIGAELLTAEHFAPLSTATMPYTGAITPAFLMSAAIAFPPTEQTAINLRKGPFARTEDSLVSKQLITAAAFTFIILGALLFHLHQQVSYLADAFETSEKEAIKQLNKESGSRDATLQAAISSAKDDATAQKERWFAFDAQSRSSFLMYLKELTQRIDRISLGLIIEKITITEGTPEDKILLKGSVKDFDALRALEKSLAQSPVFSHVGLTQEKVFTLELLAKKRGEE